MTNYCSYYYYYYYYLATFPQLVQVMLGMILKGDPLGMVVVELVQAGCPSCYPTNSVKALKDDSVSDWGQHCCRDGTLCWASLLQWSIPPVTVTMFLTWRQHAVMVSQGHCCGRTFYRRDSVAVAQLTA